MAFLSLSALPHGPPLCLHRSSQFFPVVLESCHSLSLPCLLLALAVLLQPKSSVAGLTLPVDAPCQAGSGALLVLLTHFGFFPLPHMQHAPVHINLEFK